MLTLYKKTYPHLIDKILKKKKMLIFTDIVHIHGHCVRKKFYVYSQLPVSVRIFHSAT